MSIPDGWVERGSGGKKVLFRIHVDKIFLFFGERCVVVYIHEMFIANP